MSATGERRTSLRPKRRSEEGKHCSPSHCAEDSPKARKLRKLPSLEDLERSPTLTRRTSTPRLNALTDRLTVTFFEDESRENKDDSLISDQEKKYHACTLLGLNESRRKSSEYTFKCPTCRKQFKYLSNLKSHLNIVHKNLSYESSKPLKPSNRCQEENLKAYQCEVCFKMFKYSTNLKTHRKVHTASLV